ncbi:DUF6850 family outer membrane beta-barrel protein [Bacteroides helcogenes]|uniref:DUF6850 domain-containing protein n=1 Tax=Bacteroides helcogenes (strain ATCC 35417 / DSM 20613 / JCM 6297 / CCUG 15421 / P 36-108) TaxID=693979 RepID=E6SS32_BACT6|nr:DUF6850 family outer membrane beta-barrel protein [Bacteroides helcogenes]ADV43134.1 hypothetical protein Bache_1124 [Bacteroides helcogenes P 36-108]MDY5239112.1 hypothetical protein [Bacteroides helcogenes]
MLFCGTSCSTLVAQTSHDIRWGNIAYLRQTEAWLNSENAAGLHALSIPRISTIEVYANKQNGKFVNYYQSGNSFEFGAQAESFYRLNSKTVFFGEVNYHNFFGKDMGGSYFINPNDAPFDIVEYTDSNRGDKSLEKYQLTGAVSIDLSPKISMGGKVDYTAANYAKQKDLRHVNNLLDMNLTAGIIYRLSKRVELGANYYYRRSTEGLLISMYGTTDRVYNSLISYGGFYGIVEQFGDNGYTKKNEEKPLFNEYHGGTLQLKWYILPKLQFFNELAYKSRNGYYGKKSPGTVIYSEHNSGILSYKSILSLQGQKDLHCLHIGFQRESLANAENIYRYDNEGGGKTNVNYYGTLDTTNKTIWSLDAGYTGNLEVTNGCPAWTVKGTFSYFSRNLTASVYPYYRKQRLHTTTFHLSGERNICRKKDMYSLYIGGTYASGRGSVQKDGTYTTPTESQSTPKSMTTFLYREFEFLTNKRIKGEASFKYARSIGGKGLTGFTSLHYGMTKAFGIVYLEGDRHHEITWSLGCTF